jgi:O-6-methylguanine DNA methyltransferase
LTAIYFARHQEGLPKAEWRRYHAALAGAAEQLQAYFAGERTTFDVRLDLQGTAFERRVWKELLEIPFGETVSYRDIAERIGQPKACRAVGLANGRNPVPIIVPCHRMIGSNGTLTGYGGGLEIKERLLALEGIELPRKQRRQQPATQLF